MCDILDCFSEPVAISENGTGYCIECAVLSCKKFGTKTLETIPGAVFPWDAPTDRVCPSCGFKFNAFLVGRANECTACGKFLGHKYTETDVKYEEGL